MGTIMQVAPAAPGTDDMGSPILVVQVNDYVESINQYTAGSFDGCVMINMDALTIPAAGGVDSTALIVGDFSNGNDGIIMKGSADLAALKLQVWGRRKDRFVQRVNRLRR